MVAPDAGTTIAVGRSEVARQIRAAEPLMAALRAPVTARGPWLTAVLNERAATRGPFRPVAVVVDGRRSGRPDAVAFLCLQRRGPRTLVSVLGGAARPLPGGRPTARLLARDEQAANRLAAGVLDVVAALRLPWTLALAGLPLGDPTVRALAARLDTSVVGNVRSARLVDDLDPKSGTPVVRSRDPRDLERWLPALLAGATDPRARAFLRIAARLHAAIGQLEVAVRADGEVVRSGLLTLVDGADRWPWWGTGAGGSRTEMGAPLVGLTARGWPSRAALSPRAAR